jgi:uncharacterized protein YbaR (Trm112 family)
MDRALAERLVCPGAHGPDPLVLRVDVAVGDGVRAGVAGCFVCRQEWPLQDGALHMGPLSPLPTVDAPSAEALTVLLGLADPGASVLVDGLPDDVIAALAQDAGARLVALDAPARPATAVAVRGAPLVPFAAGTFAAAACCRPGRDAPWMASLVRALRPGARVVAPDALPLPAGLRELARAEGIWVAERQAGAAPVPLRRA